MKDQIAGAGVPHGIHRTGSPWQNGHVESFDEPLPCEVFNTRVEARVPIG